MLFPMPFGCFLVIDRIFRRFGYGLVATTRTEKMKSVLTKFLLLEMYIEEGKTNEELKERLTTWKAMEKDGRQHRWVRYLL